MWKGLPMHRLILGGGRRTKRSWAETVYRKKEEEPPSAMLFFIISKFVRNCWFSFETPRFLSKLCLVWSPRYLKGLAQDLIPVLGFNFGPLPSDDEMFQAIRRRPEWSFEPWKWQSGRSNKNGNGNNQLRSFGQAGLFFFIFLYFIFLCFMKLWYGNK